jgi:hypothetical protein
MGFKNEDYFFGWVLKSVVYLCLGVHPKTKIEKRQDLYSGC